MEIRLDHPEVLTDFEAAPQRRVRWWTWFGMALWLLLLAGDWGARFRVFRWQDLWLGRPVSAAQPNRLRDPLAWDVPEQTGATLSQMVPLPWIAARYEEFHPGYRRHQDEWGYFNEPPPPAGGYSVVMLGDSFLLSLGTQHLAQALAAVGGIPVYNHGMYGAGPFKEIRNFIGADRFDPPPQVLVWNLSARELGAPLFLRQSVETWFDHAGPAAVSGPTARGPQVRWDLLVPAELRRAWPNTSLMAYAGRRAWARVKLLVFRAWPQDVLGADDPRFGPMLFYRENLRVLPLLTPADNAPAVAQTVQQVSARFRERGLWVVALLVPEKEQIYARALPPKDQQALGQGDALLAAIEAELQAAGVPVVNLMPPFRLATDQGVQLYWRDDTHWNDAGIRLAAEELWRTVEPLLEGKRESIFNIQHSISNDQVSDR